MTVPGNINALMLGGQRGYQIERSLRFNSPDSAYLNRTPASAGNRRTWTWSGWVKRSTLAEGFLFAAGTSNALRFGIIFSAQGNQEITIVATQGGSNVLNLITTPVYRDVSAWYHLVFAVDTTQATSSNRAKLYINGVQVTALATATYPAQNTDLEVNTTNPHVHGCRGTYTVDSLFDGYLTEINFIDGQALTPSSFGETNPVTGVWGPKRYAGTYGTNGFYLKFADNSNTTAATLGKDSSGNGNNWTPNNFSVTAGVGNDSMIDVPTPYADGGNGRGNYCTLNAVSPLASGTLSNGNLSFSTGNADAIAVGTVAVSSGKWYWEITATNVNASLAAIGIIGQPPASLTVDLRTPSNGYCYISNGNKGNNNTTAAYGATYTSSDVIGVALDLDAGTLVFYKNNSSQGAAYSSLSGTFSPAIGDLSGASGGAVFDCNFGQHAFAYTPPTGFLALNTQNLPEPSIKKPSSYMDATLYTGNGSTQTISGLGFSPDLVWLKCRSAANTHALVDSVRGVTKYLVSASTDAETTDAGGITSLNSDGFSLTFPTSSAPTINANAATYVAWCWDESATPGFDIVTYTGNGTNRTIAHSLGVAPKFIITKSRTTADDWFCYHDAIGNTKYILLNSTAASTTSSTIWNNTSPTSSTFSLGTSGGANRNGDNFVAYCFSEVACFSKFGSYTGNNSADGPFVHCGFRPRYVLVKDTISAGYWGIFDAVRSSYNVGNQFLQAQSSSAEDSTYPQIDFLSNGFKLRANNATSAQNNVSGNTYIFAAFAESPFKYSLAR